MKRNAARLAAKITEKLAITPVLEEGESGQLDVFVGDVLVSSRSSLLRRLLGPSDDKIVAEIAKRLPTE